MNLLIQKTLNIELAIFSLYYRNSLEIREFSRHMEVSKTNKYLLSCFMSLFQNGVLSFFYILMIIGINRNNSVIFHCKYIEISISCNSICYIKEFKCGWLQMRDNRYV